MPTFDREQSRQNARDDLEALLVEWADEHPELVRYSSEFARELATYAFDQLLSE